MISKHFRPKNSYSLVRIGPKNQSGFVLEKISFNKANFLVSMGLATNIDFEIDFYKKKNCKIHCYDHTINKSFWRRANFENIALLIFRIITLDFKKIKLNFARYKKYKQFLKFFRNKKIKHFEEAVGFGKYGVSFKQTVKRTSSKNILFKINIEGFEYRILDEIVKYKKNICGLVIEFHNADIHTKIIENFIKKLNFNLIHICASGYDYSGKNIPSSVTITFSKYKKILDTKPNYPNSYDGIPDTLELKKLYNLTKEI